MIDVQLPLQLDISLRPTLPEKRVLERRDFLPTTSIIYFAASLAREHDEVFSGDSTLEARSQYIELEINILHAATEDLIIPKSNISTHIDPGCMEDLNRSVSKLSSKKLSIDTLMDISEAMEWQIKRLRRKFLLDLLLHSSELPSGRAEAGIFDTRWMMRKDFAEVMEMKAESAEEPSSLEGIIFLPYPRKAVGMVTEAGSGYDLLAAFTVHELHEKFIHLLELVVDPALRRRGYGTAALNKLKIKLSHHRRNYLTMDVHAGNLPALEFLKANKFKWTNTIPKGAIDGGDVFTMAFAKH